MSLYERPGTVVVSVRTLIFAAVLILLLAFEVAVQARRADRLLANAKDAAAIAGECLTLWGRDLEQQRRAVTGKDGAQ